MPNTAPRKTRKDKGTTRHGRERDRTYAFRLNSDKPDERAVIDAIDTHLKEHKGTSSVKKIIMTCIGERLPNALTKEEMLHETFEQQINRLAQTIDKLLSLNLQRMSGKTSEHQSEDDTGGVNMAYLAKIRETLRGKK